MEDESSDSIKRVLGMPMRWEARNIFKNLWNRDDDRIFPPKYFGIGWDVNLHAVARRLERLAQLLRR